MSNIEMFRVLLPLKAFLLMHGSCNDFGNLSTVKAKGKILKK